MTNIKRIFAIGYALDCIAITYGNVAIEKDGYSVLLNSDNCNGNDLVNAEIAIDALLESHGFEEVKESKFTKEYFCEELETTVSITII